MSKKYFFRYIKRTVIYLSMKKISKNDMFDCLNLSYNNHLKCLSKNRTKKKYQINKFLF